MPTPKPEAADQVLRDRPSPDRILLRLDWKVIHRLDGLLQGDYRSLFYGYGVDFADLREYQPEDDIRYIDWNVTARMNTPYVRKYMEDREIMAWFLLDFSPSMDFGTVNSQKREVVIDFVGTLARLLTRHGNRAGAMIFTGTNKGEIQHTIPARGGRMHVLRIINDMLKQPRLQRAQYTDLTPLIYGGLHRIKKRSLVFLISDFFCAPGWEQSLALLNHKHEVIAVRLWDPRESELPDVGTVIMEDSETGEQLFVDTHDRVFRTRFFEAARRREEGLQAAFRHAGVDVLSLSTEDDLVRAILRFAKMRQQRRQPSQSQAQPAPVAGKAPGLR